MSVSKIAGLVLASASMVAGHGYVSGAVVDGTYYTGFLVDTYNYMSSVPENIGWAEKATDNGFVDGSSYSSSDIICHKDATPGAISAEVKAGGSVELQWTDWPESHHGPVITYMANCNGDCSSVDKTTLEFFKIDEGGLIDDSSVPGKWASDQLIAANNSRTVTIPSAIASGNYVLRHEIIGLHSAGNSNGAQNYPQCLNLKVTGGGSDKPSGTLGTALYKNTDPGILVNIYTSMSSYTIPGPALYTGASSGSGSGAATTAAATAAATTAAASSVSAIPIASSSFSHPTYSRTKRPSHSATPSIPSISMPSAPEATPVGAPSDATVTDYATAQVTDQPAIQTASAATVTAPGQSVQSAVPAADNESSAEGTATTAAAVPVPTSSTSSGSSSSGSSSSGSSSTTTSTSDYSSYLSSLSADQLVSVIRSTLKWLVSDKKVHARDLSI
ncbi:hypothetical protein N7499_008187 [Penicillium canescens]|uniref:Auxiliary Activity family 9 catalytic domain-containing protein n=1 Tax=Penicillium canescens TaxID=5083 RepID=A0AAD6N2I3_PENCN|nr:uncharacterized protein N7446_013222 [Penicillium canescens]KAJ5985529.1 hypothetical protein N7522_012725 [Penicillium canescens]KAJ6022869.1 hypothetical protein N7460_013264 [Penicillium canescens]KAJ6025869.1 hypothetical protein N7444_013548 [Penicillium canescens]KAJ6042156.1 hypothetical protein N7446_013222 [Penicillium canescens]KAJ6076206.1 hypothetical protein N7499_008187 [Penicillium canescens]